MSLGCWLARCTSTWCSQVGDLRTLYDRIIWSSMQACVCSFSARKVLQVQARIWLQHDRRQLPLAAMPSPYPSLRRYPAHQPAQPARHGAPLPAHWLRWQDILLHSLEGEGLPPGQQIASLRSLLSGPRFRVGAGQRSRGCKPLCKLAATAAVVFCSYRNHCLCPCAGGLAVGSG